MSQADIETLRAVYEVVSRGDWDAALREAPPGFEFKTGDRVTNPETLRGGEEVRRFFEDLWGPSRRSLPSRKSSSSAAIGSWYLC
jgi:hypothetical protein